MYIQCLRCSVKFSYNPIHLLCMHISTGSIHITLLVRKGIREERGTEVWEREVGVNQGLTSTKIQNGQ